MLFDLLRIFAPFYIVKTWKKKAQSSVLFSILNNSVDNGFFQRQIIQYIDHIRYSFVACNGCLFLLLRTENHPVMVAEDFIHSWDTF
jgi:hypothetical protein